jgi:hypothetical protein
MTDPATSGSQSAPARSSGVEAVLTALQKVVEVPDGKPRPRKDRKKEAATSVAVTGWSNAGEPDIADLLTKRLPARTHVVVAFNALDWEKEPRAAGALLAADVATEAGRRRRRWRRIFQPVATEMTTPQVRWWRRVAAVGISAIAATVVVALPSVRDAFASLTNKGGVVGELATHAVNSPVATVMVIAALYFFVAVRAWNATTAVARFASSARSEAARGTSAEICKELRKLIRQALRHPRWTFWARLWRRRRDTRRFVVVLNGTEHCDDDFVLELLEVARKILAIGNVVIVLVGELDGIRAAADRKFTTPDGTTNYQRSRKLMHKLVRTVLPLPRPGRAEAQERDT